MLSLGHGVFFGLGAYAMGMHLMLEIGSKSVYQSALPDFMVWNQVKELPLFWQPFYSASFTLAAIVVVPALFALVFGFLAFRSRVRGVYFSIITQALALSAWLVFNRNEMNLGGTNGLADFKTVFGVPLNRPATQRGLYVVTALTLVAAYGAVPLDHPSRGRERCWSPSATARRACSSRATRRPTTSSSCSWSRRAWPGWPARSTRRRSGSSPRPRWACCRSIEMVVWVAAGGRGTLVGAVVGAIGVNWIQSWLTTSYPDLWLLFLGALFMGVVLFIPRRRRRRARPPRRSASAGVAAVATRRLSTRPPTARAGLGPAMHGRLRIDTMSDAIVYLEDVTVDYDGFKALDRLNFYMDRRELRVVIGPNGAGKTTLLDVISGRVKPAHGRVIFGRSTDLTALQREPDRRAGHRPQVPDAVGVREPHGVGQRRAVAAAAEQGRAGRRCSSADAADARERIAATLDHGRPRGQGRRAGRRAVARREAVARDRHGDGAGPGAAAGGRAGGRA